MNGWSPSDVELLAGQVVGASVTDLAISKHFRITAGGSTSIVIVLKVSGVTVGGGITAKLQTGLDGVFVDSKTVSVTGAGLVPLRLDIRIAGDQAFLPLLASGRVVISTGAGSALTIDSVSVLQED